MQPSAFVRQYPLGAIGAAIMALFMLAAVFADLITTISPDSTNAAISLLRPSVGHWLGAGLADLAAILDPGCFVLGGGVSDAGDLLLGQVRMAFDSGLTGRQYRPHAAIVMAELGPDAGLIGAADLARRR